MRFAKLFTFPQGQLLATLHESTARAEADAPYRILLYTESPYGRGVQLVLSYALEQERDQEFARFDEGLATTHFLILQHALATDTVPC